jgi:hypothetical protein
MELGGESAAFCGGGIGRMDERSAARPELAAGAQSAGTQRQRGKLDRKLGALHDAAGAREQSAGDRRGEAHGCDGYYAPTPANEADRVAVNAWIRQPGHFDSVIDFNAVMRDPQHPERLLPAYNSGDHLHPGPAGYKAMGDAVPLASFR